MKYAILILTCFAFLISCESENEEDLFPQSTTEVPKDTTSGLTISFDTDIQPLIQANCATAGCHVTNFQSPTLETYIQIEASKSRIDARVSASTMPPSGFLAQSDKDKIATWISEGARNN